MLYPVAPFVLQVPAAEASRGAFKNYDGVMDYDGIMWPYVNTYICSIDVFRIICGATCDQMFAMKSSRHNPVRTANIIPVNIFCKVDSQQIDEFENNLIWNWWARS